MDFCHLIVTCLFSMRRLPFDNQKVKGNYAIFSIKVLDFLRVERVQLNASVNNIYTFSKYSGVNPENVNSLGYDVSGGYPNSRNYTMGISIDF